MPYPKKTDSRTTSRPFNLEYSVDRVRVKACQVGWQGATTRVAVPRKGQDKFASTKALTTTPPSWVYQ